MNIKINLLALSAFVLSSCAGTYKTIVPKSLPFQKFDTGGDLNYAYSYSVLRAAGNKKYANKEFKKGVKLVAVEIENTTDRTLNFRNDIKMYNGNRLVYPMEPTLIFKSLKQPAPLFLLWGLLWLTFTDCDDNTGECSVTPIPLGLGIGLINVGIAGGANKKFMDNLITTNILDRDIKPGETVYGLIGIATELAPQLSFKIE